MSRNLLTQEQSAAPKEKYDVYVNEPQPLAEGEEKHTISVFVADEAGLINRVAGVFARRGGWTVEVCCTDILGQFKVVRCFVRMSFVYLSQER